MTKEKIIELMADAGLKAPAMGDFIFIHWDQIDMLLTYQRNLSLEEAAKVCDEHAAKAEANGYTVKGETFIDGFGDGSCACAAAIRGLK